MTPLTDAPDPQPVSVTSLEHSIWPGLHAKLDVSLKRLALAHLSAPTKLVLHDAVDCTVKALHFDVFRRLAEADFGMLADDNENNLEGLFSAEVSEHGSQNIAQYCKENDWHVDIGFPHDGDAIVSISSLIRGDVTSCNTAKLVEALGYVWEESALAEFPAGCKLTLRKRAERKTPANSAILLDTTAGLDGVRQVCEKLGYGLLRFSSAGELIAASRSILENLKLPVDETALDRLAAAIPFNFYFDTIWGLALTGQNGVFENYRTRVRPDGDEERSVLFNVSGYRDAQAVIHTLWQVVSFDDGGAGLGEGSILSEARIHNITRNYVPQLVEEKAREAVRLGKDKLINEECRIAVLFCDIVGFTSFVESNASSESVINTLNTILRRVSSSVKRYHGSIDKFMGDSVMAIFRDPGNAVSAALDMQKHSEDINGLRSRAGQDALRLRIGIHWGEVVIGNVGTPERLDWTAIGDVVNTASRIEKNCNPGSILISRELRDAIDLSQHQEIICAEPFDINVKGKRESLSVCHVRHADDTDD